MINENDLPLNKTHGDTMSETSFRKFLWMELIGFDNRQADYGVGEFLSRMPVRPEVISIIRIMDWRKTGPSG